MRELFIVSLIFAIAIIPIAQLEIQAGTIFNGTNYTNVNYTNIYTNKTYMDLIKSVEGKTLPKRDLDFGITISNTCYNIHRYLPVNSTTNCPTYEAIMAIFPDTSNQFVSGEFVYKHNMLQRDKPRMTDSYNWYDFSNRTYLFIDPPHDMMSQLSIIHIESTLGTYKLSNTVENNTLYLGEGRYVDSCREVTIGSENWIFMIGDSMEYLRNDCHPTFTLFNGTKMIQTPYVIHDITTTSKWLHDTFIEWVKENCLYEYDKC